MLLFQEATDIFGKSQEMSFSDAKLKQIGHHRTHVKQTTRQARVRTPRSDSCRIWGLLKIVFFFFFLTFSLACRLIIHQTKLKWNLTVSSATNGGESRKKGQCCSSSQATQSGKWNLSLFWRFAFSAWKHLHALYIKRFQGSQLWQIEIYFSDFLTRHCNNLSVYYSAGKYW